MSDNKNNFKPYIPADRVVPEFTVISPDWYSARHRFRCGECISGSACRYDDLRLYSGGGYFHGNHPRHPSQRLHSGK